MPSFLDVPSEDLWLTLQLAMCVFVASSMEAEKCTNPILTKTGSRGMFSNVGRKSQEDN